MKLDTKLTPKESRCSCDRCDSALCFSIRNTDIKCSCNPCPSENKTGYTTKCNINQKMQVNDVLVSHVPDAILKDGLNKYNNMENEQMSRTQSKTSIKKVTMESKASYISVGRFVDEDQYLNALNNTAMSDPLSSQLVAQIMNLHGNENERVSYKKSVLQTISLKYPNDIFKRIKEVYKACSCKVCECIVGKSITNNDTCDCKPCVCNKCKFTMTKNMKELLPADDEGCPCVRCDRKEQCKGSDNKNSVGPRVCDCNPRHQNKFNFYQKPCNCKPCQCVDCLIAKGIVRQPAMVVAPMEQNFVACDCSPCECSECVRSYRMPTDITTRHEMSTGVDRHPRCHCESCTAEACVPDSNDTCWCVRQSKIMSKPFQKNIDEYDIRRAELLLKFKQADVKKDTVAMFAEVTNHYPHHKTAAHLTKCDCGHCECIVCNKTRNKEIKAKTGSVNVPERDCEANRNKYYPNEQPPLNINENCACGTCECIECVSLKPTKENPSIRHKTHSKIAYSFKNSLTKEYHKSKHNYQRFLENRASLHLQNEHQPAYSKPNTVDYLMKRQHHTSDSKETPLNTMSKVKSLGAHFHENVFQCIEKTNTRFKEPEINKVPKVNSLIKKKKTDEDKENEPFIDSYASFIKDSGSITPQISRHRKSGQSSLNSSGHDYADYLIHFPKSHVEEYINDVMKTNFPTRYNVDSNNNMNKPLHIPTRYSNDKSVVNENIDFSLSSKYGDESVLGKNTVKSDNRLFKVNACQKKDSSQEQVDAQNNQYRQTKSYDNTLLTENYRRIQNTLKEAREFSQQLVKLLNKYEDANKHFDSVSSKFKPSYFSINHELLKYREENAKYNSYNQRLNTNILVLPSMVNDDKNKSDKNEKKFIKAKYNNPNNIPEKEKTENIPTEHKYMPAMHINEMHMNKKETAMFTGPFYNHIYVANENSQTDQINKENHVKECLASTTHETKDKQNVNAESKQKETEKKKKFKGYKYLYKRTITASKKIKLFPKHTDLKYDASIVTEEAITRQGQTVENKEVIHVSKSIIAINESKTVATAPNPTSYKSSETNADVQAQPKPKSNIVEIKSLGETKPTTSTAESPKKSTVTKKNLFQETEFNVRSKPIVIPKLPTLEMEIKDALKLFSTKPKEIDLTQILHRHTKNETLIIQDEAKKLMDSKVFQPFTGKDDIKDKKEKVEVNAKEAKLTPNHKQQSKEGELKLLYHCCSRHRKIPSDKYENLQVNYVCLRKVSDHTVFVKWNAPQDINKVQGYEILVDGRVVHKIYNATKCMAVVSCLPASQKTLLTVRTVPNVPDVKRILATTIVYRPKSKKLM